ncbi:MAG: M56 family metallopeptidase, partial [Acutalibacteraceae bacterium]
MSGLFLKILNLGITASYVIAAVMLLRLIFRKKAPKKLICALWILVGLRLVCPFSLESVLSLIPSAETVPPEIVSSPSPQITSGFAAFNSVVNPVLSESFAPTPEQSVSPMQVLTEVGAWVWLAGMIAVCLYGLISYLRLKRKMADAVLLSGNIFQSEKAESPFILGFVKPKIYLPFTLSDADRENVIAHETAHIRRKDHIIKPFAFLLLTVYWFNPLVWVSYVLLCRDIELACDEKVIKALSEDSRKEYAKSLLDCAVKRKSIAACPLAFGEVGVKTRIKGVMNYKKPAFWVILITVAAIIVTSVCFLTNPKKDGDKVGSSDFDSVTVYESKTDYDGKVTLTLTEASVRTQSPYFIVKLQNGTDKDISYGEEFVIVKDDPYRSVTSDVLVDMVYHALAYTVKPGGENSLTYYLDGYDLSEKGNYTFCLPFTVDGEKYKASFGFGFDDNMQVINLTVSESTVGDKKESIQSASALIAPNTTNELIGTVFDITKVEGDTVTIVLRDSDGNETGEFTLKKGGDSVTFSDSVGSGEATTKTYRFVITDMPTEAQGTVYIASDAIWENGYFSSLAPTGMQYWITDDGELLTNVDESIEPYESRWATLGTLTKSDLTLEKFKSCISSCEWSYAVTPEQLFEENKEILQRKLDAVSYCDIYIFFQKNGDIFLVDGFDDKSFRAVYKLTNTTSVAGGYYGEVTWTKGVYSSLVPENIKVFLKSDRELLTYTQDSNAQDGGHWISLGTLSNSAVTQEEFQNYVNASQWCDYMTVGELFENNREILYLKADTGLFESYYVFLQNNGERYLALGSITDKDIRGVYELVLQNAPTEAQVWQGTEYRMTDAGSGKTVPTLTLNRSDNSFSFTFDPLSSYLSYGTYEQADGKIICNDVHGTVTFQQALNQSCNVAFAQIAVQLGADNLNNAFQQAGLATPHKTIDRITSTAGSFSTSTENSKSEIGWAGIGQSTTLVNPYSF